MRHAEQQERPVQDRETSKKHRGKETDDRNRKNTADTIIANMERWRWLPRDLGETHVVVNIPDFTLGVYKDGALRLAHQDRGRKARRAGDPAAQRDDEISHDQSDLERATLDHPERVSAGARTRSRRTRADRIEGQQQPDGSLRVYQPPGERNALGRIRFNFPNQFLVYQHDTPDKKLFARDSRAFSHGCMRVQNPEKYAEVLLSLSQPAEDYTIARIRGLYGDQERTINLKQPIPVHVTYQTAFVGPQGQLNVRPDIYGLDTATLKLMRNDERMIADTPIARPQNASSKPVMARAPAREDRELQGQSRNGGWFAFGAAERSFASAPYRSRSPYRGFDRADGLW